MSVRSMVLIFEFTGPGGFDVPASFSGVNNNTNGTPRLAQYVIIPPGGMWDFPDNGVHLTRRQ